MNWSELMGKALNTGFEARKDVKDKIGIIESHAKTEKNGNAGISYEEDDDLIIDSSDGDDFVSEQDLALENGCYIDDDGNWEPIDDEMADIIIRPRDLDEIYASGAFDNPANSESEADKARKNGYYIDEKGEQVPMDDDDLDF